MPTSPNSVRTFAPGTMPSDGGGSLLALLLLLLLLLLLSPLTDVASIAESVHFSEPMTASEALPSVVGEGGVHVGKVELTLQNGDPLEKENGEAATGGGFRGGPSGDAAMLEFPVR